MLVLDTAEAGQPVLLLHLLLLVVASHVLLHPPAHLVHVADVALAACQVDARPERKGAPQGYVVVWCEKIAANIRV